MGKLVILVVLAGVLFGGCNDNGESNVSEGATTAAAVSTTAAVATIAETTATEITVAEVREIVKKNKPVDIINDIPLYIEYEGNLGLTASENRNVYTFIGEENRHPRARTIAVSYDGSMMDVRLYELYHDWKNNWSDDSSYWLGKKIFDIWIPSTFNEDGFVLNFKIVSSHVLVLTDDNGNSYSYRVGENDGSLNVVKTDIEKRKRGNDGVKAIADGKENITVKFYNIGIIDTYYENGEINYSKMPYTSDTVSVESFAEDFAEKMLLYSGIRVDDIWYEGSKLNVDLNVYEKYHFGMGSTAGSTLSADLMQTLRSLPNIEKIEVWLDGERGIESDHFSFGITTV
ncbi:MAG: hypothetical protein FWG90_09310 [Oscillospiraceae bacterium]|nr:hypothetical protein [Oscillospiraceae bacterium]